MEVVELRLSALPESAPVEAVATAAQSDLRRQLACASRCVGSPHSCESSSIDWWLNHPSQIRRHSSDETNGQLASCTYSVAHSKPRTGVSTLAACLCWACASATDGLLTKRRVPGMGVADWPAFHRIALRNHGTGSGFLLSALQLRI